MPLRPRLYPPKYVDFLAKMRAWHVVSHLGAHALPVAGVDCEHVEVQICAQTIWTGYLPWEFDLAELQALWQDFSRQLQLLPGIRVFSGPFPQVQARKLQDIRQSSRNRRTGMLLVSLMPERRAGGVKEENKQLAVSRVAATCLDRGISLSEASEASEKLISKSGANAALAALQSPDVSSRWTALEALAKQYDLSPGLMSHTEHLHRQWQHTPWTTCLRPFAQGLPGASEKVLASAPGSATQLHAAVPVAFRS